MASTRAHEVPDGSLIVTARSIITMSPRQPRVEAVAIESGRIRAIGTLATCRQALPDAERIDLPSAVLMPGFVEPHSHPIPSGMSTEHPAINVAPWLVPTWAGVQEVARRAAADVPAGRSIVLSGVDRLLHGCAFPDAAVMDELFGDRIAIIIALSQHQVAVTTSALRMLGWLDNPPTDPSGGHYGRRTDGSLDGTASEIPAIMPLLNPILDLVVDKPLGQVAAYVARLATAGITTMADLGYLSSYLPDYETLCLETCIPVRVSLYHATNEPSHLEPLRSAVPSTMLQKAGIKFWADGSPWLGTVATSFPYLDTEVVRNAGITDLHPGRKALNYDRADLDAMLARSAGSGWQVACHANGDLTIDLVLDAYEHALTEQGLIGTDHRWRLEHVGATTAEQLQRMARLGVIPTFGLFQLMQWGDLLDGQLFDSRYGARWSPVGDAAHVGDDLLHPSFHNDGSISPPSPMANVQAAVTRRSNAVSADGVYRLAVGAIHSSDQRVPLTLALRAITINAAYILGRDHEIGSIEPGKLADFTILSADPYDVDPLRISVDAQVLGTWLSGRPTDPALFVDQAAHL